METNHLKSIFNKKRVMVTGDTGFKGSWLSLWLHELGADVLGFSLPPEQEEAHYNRLELGKIIHHVDGDICDLDQLQTVFNEFKPEILFHLAAQAIVRVSYQEPKRTFDTNIGGSVNILEVVRKSESLKSVVYITSDKCYKNNEWTRGYREDDVLGGHDPYSASKAAAEIVFSAYWDSFLMQKKDLGIASARAGNVIGGGDFAKDRIIADCVRAIMNKSNIIVRNPQSIRPYQHVLEPLFAYLMIAEKQYENHQYADYYNIGPDEHDCFNTRDLVDLFVRKWGDSLKWIEKNDGGPHEAHYLRLDCSRLKSRFNWKPRWNLEKAVEKTVEWTKYWLNGEDVNTCMDRQIKEFLDN